MQSSTPSDDGDNQKQTNALAKFSGIAFQMIAIIGVFAFAGYKIDQLAANQTKWVTAILSLAGVFIAMYLVIRSIKQ